MPIDPSIILGYKPPQIESPLNALGDALKVKSLQQQGELGALQLEEGRRSAEDTRQTAEAYKSSLNADGTVNRNTLYSTLAQRGLGAKLPAVQKGFADQDKSKADTEKAQIEAHLKKFEVAGQIMAGVNDQASWELARQKTAQVFGPEVAAQMPVQYDPALVEQKRQQALTVKDQLEQKWKAMEYTTPNANAVLQSNTSIQNNLRTVDASRDNANATRAVAQATRDAAKIQGDQNTEMKLGDDYRAQSKNFKETADAYKQITAVLDKATTSPAATLAGATKFMKMIDPGSVVRESELGMALAATGVFDRATNYFNVLQSGKVLTANQVKDFKAITKQINDAASQQQKLIDRHFSSVATQYGLRPGMVVQDFGQNAAPAAAPAPDVPTDIAAILAKHGGKKGL